MTLTATSFWYQAALNAIGPLITAVVGLLLAGLAVNFVTRGVQDRRAAKELKYGLISEITETASFLYHHIVQYNRARTDPVDSACDKAAADEECKILRKELLFQYVTTRAQAESLEARLTAYFEEPHLPVAWHAVRDCLTVLYYHEVSRDRPELPTKIKSKNSKGQEQYHTGLEPGDLDDPDKVINAYKCHLKTTAKLIVACPLRPRRNSRRAHRAIKRALEQAKNENFNYSERVESESGPFSTAALEEAAILQKVRDQIRSSDIELGALREWLDERPARTRP